MKSLKLGVTHDEESGELAGFYLPHENGEKGRVSNVEATLDMVSQLTSDSRIRLMVSKDNDRLSLL